MTPHCRFFKLAALSYVCQKGIQKFVEGFPWDAILGCPHFTPDDDDPLVHGYNMSST
jgi:hypothetical protein